MSDRMPCQVTSSEADHGDDLRPAEYVLIRFVADGQGARYLKRILCRSCFTRECQISSHHQPIWSEKFEPAPGKYSDRWFVETLTRIIGERLPSNAGNVELEFTVDPEGRIWL